MTNESVAIQLKSFNRVGWPWARRRELCSWQNDGEHSALRVQLSVFLLDCIHSQSLPRAALTDLVFPPSTELRAAARMAARSTEICFLFEGNHFMLLLKSP